MSSRTAKLISISFIVLLTGKSLGVNVPLESLSSRSYSTRHGLPSNIIWDIIQDHYGFIWTATDQGISCYDSQDFMTYDQFPAGIDRNVFKIIQDTKGNYWLAGRNALLVLQGGKITAVEPMPAEKGLPVTDIMENKETQTIYAIFNGHSLYAIRKGRSFRLLPSTEFPDITINHLTSWSGGNTLVCSSLGILKIDPDDSVTKLEMDVDSFLPSRILVEDEASIWLAEDKDRIAYYKNGKKMESIDLQLNTRVYAMVNNPGGGLWIGTTKGLFLWRDQTISRFTVDNGICSNLIYSLFIDREGILWYGSDNGLGKILGLQFRRLIPSSLLPISSVMDIQMDHEGCIWMATSEGIVSIKDNEAKHYSIDEGLKDDYITSILVSRDGRLIAASLNGLYLFNGSTFSQIVEEDGNVVHDMFQDVSGTIWIASGKGLLNLSNGKIVNRMKELHLPDGVDYTCVFQDTGGTIWIGTDGQGLYQIQGTNVTSLDDLPSKQIWCFDQAEEDAIWIGTSAGAYLLTAQGIQKSLTEADGLNSGNIWTIQQDAYGSVWLATSRGLSCYKNRRIYNHDVEDGINSDDFTSNCMILDRQKRIWFGGSGITIVDPRYSNPIIQPVIYLKSSTAGEDIIRLGDRLDHNNNSVEFSFICVSFINENRNMYRYQLLGFDRTRSEPTKNSTIRYTNLPTGKYKLIAVAVNRDGFWTAEPVVFNFEILPAFWELYWVQSLTGIVIIGLIWGMARYRSERIRARAKWLQEEVDRQTEIIKKQLMEIAQQRDRLEHLATTDDLTSLFNRRYFFRALAAEWKRHERYMRPLSLILFDVDHFKDFNDTYGHAFGDEVLITVAQEIQKQIRSVDTLARFGGEEFIVLLPETDENIAVEVANRIRTHLSELKIAFGSVEIHGVNISGGVSTKQATRGAFNPDNLIHQADMALYEAKEGGRKQIRIYKSHSLPNQTGAQP